MFTARMQLQVQVLLTSAVSHAQTVAMIWLCHKMCKDCYVPNNKKYIYFKICVGHELLTQANMTVDHN